MTDLSPKARELLHASRKALRANDADRARIEDALRARLGSDALPSDAGSAHAGGIAATPIVAGAAIAACVVGAVAFLMVQPRASEPVPPARATSTAPAVEALAPSAPPVANLEPPAAPASSARTEPRGATAPRRRDPLAQEVALLSRATRALRAGDAVAALEALEQHQRSFPDGALSVERRTAKAQALCALGRVSQGRSELARLDPATPAAARARQACDVVVGATHNP